MSRAAGLGGVPDIAVCVPLFLDPKLSQHWFHLGLQPEAMTGRLPFHIVSSLTLLRPIVEDVAEEPRVEDLDVR